MLNNEAHTPDLMSMTEMEKVIQMVNLHLTTKEERDAVRLTLHRLWRHKYRFVDTGDKVAVEYR